VAVELVVGLGVVFAAFALAPWLARWINPDAAGSIDGLNLYVYVGNNPLKYIDPTAGLGFCLYQQ
jgi:RHS repeat-associated protein